MCEAGTSYTCSTLPEIRDDGVRPGLHDLNRFGPLTIQSAALVARDEAVTTAA